MNNSPEVAIVIPTYNRRLDVQRAIDSALNQTYENIKILVSDNKSFDSSYEYLVDKYKNNINVKIQQQETNIGPLRNWEYCINNTNSPFVKILWSDDELLLNTIESCLSKLKDDVAFVFCPATIISSKQNITCYSSKYLQPKIKSRNFIKLAMLEMNVPYSPGAILARTADLKEYFQYFNSLTFNVKNEMVNNGIGPDLLLILFVASKYKFVGYASDTAVIFNAGNDSITTSSGILKISKYYDIAKLIFIKTIGKNYINFILPLIFVHSVDCALRYRERYFLKPGFVITFGVSSYIIAMPLVLLVIYRKYLQPRIFRFLPNLRSWSI